MIMPPYLLRPPKQDVLDHFRRIREAVPLPIMIYDVPILSGVEVTPQEIQLLAKEDVVHSVKWSHLEVTRIQDTRLLCGPDFGVFVGVDLIGLAGLAAGADGYISGLPMIVPRLARQLFDIAHDRQDIAAARELWYRLLPLVRFEYRALTADPGNRTGWPCAARLPRCAAFPWARSGCRCRDFRRSCAKSSGNCCASWENFSLVASASRPPLRIAGSAGVSLRS